MKVMKFGGTSVGSPEMIRQVSRIVLEACAHEPVVVVVSAMSGVTDQLERAAGLASAGDEDYHLLLRQIEKRHLLCVGELLSVQSQSSTSAGVKMLQNELEDKLQGLFLLRELTPRSRDAVMGFGERFSSYIITNYLKCRGLDAVLADSRQLILTDNSFGTAAVRFEETYRQVRDYFRGNEKLVILPGFIGATADHQTTTLGRGGSDYTASIIAAALQADDLEIWTDVDGMMTADPRKVVRAFPLKQLSYVEALELSHCGAKVLYPSAVLPVQAKNIPLRIKNTFHPEQAGTLVGGATEKSSLPVKGISSIDAVALISLSGSGMAGIPGAAARLFGALAKAKINAILIAQGSSEYSVTVAVAGPQAGPARQQLEEEFLGELAKNCLNPVGVAEGYSVLAIVGENLRRTSHVAARLFCALDKKSIQVCTIAQGGSEHNISFVTRQEDAREALNLVHMEFFTDHAEVLHVFVLGAPAAGHALAGQVYEQIPDRLRNRGGEIRIVGIANSGRMLFRKEGIDATDWQTRLDDAEQMELSRFLARMKGLNLPNSLLVNCLDTAAGPGDGVKPEPAGAEVFAADVAACCGHPG